MAIEDDIKNSMRSLKSAILSKTKAERNVDIEEDNTEAYFKALKALGGAEVLVGIPEGTDDRDEPGIGNAALAYIHETGSPINNIPARPFLVPGVRDSQGEWMPYIAAAGKAAMKGDDGGMMGALNSAGTIAEQAVKTRILDGIPPPLKRPRYRGPTLAPVPVDEATPLVDTGQMLRSITHVVRRG